MMNTLYVNYTKSGKAIPDHLCEEEILKQASICVNGQSKEFQVSTENAVICARAMKITGKITCDLQIMFEGNLLEMNRYYVIIHGYPYGFCDYTEKWAAQLIGTGLDIKKRDDEIIKLHRPARPENVKNIGVICVDGDDFIDFRITQGYDDGSIGTRRKFKYYGITYWRISKVEDLCSLNLDRTFETMKAKTNPEYEEIINVVHINLTPQK